jgi:tetratricopeptide (TPR) repeat protein
MKLELLLLFAFILPCIAIAQNEEKINAILKEGIALHDAGKYDEAIKTYERGLALEPNAQVLYYEIAYANYAKGDHKEAIKQAKKALKLEGKNSANAYILLGNTQDLMGKPKKAIKTFKKAIKKHPENHLLQYNLGLTSFNLNELDQAEKALIEAISINSAHASSHYLLGFTKMNQGKNVQALLAFTFFLLLEPNSQRSENALKSTENLLGIHKKIEETNTIFLSLNALQDESEFSTAEMMLSLSSASIKMKTDSMANVTEEDKFHIALEKIYAFLKESKNDQNSFWWSFYVDIYAEILEHNHFETFCYFISQQKEGEVFLWLEKNEDKVKAMIDFLNEG